MSAVQREPAVPVTGGEYTMTEVLRLSWKICRNYSSIQVSLVVFLFGDITIKTWHWCLITPALRENKPINEIVRTQICLNA